MTFIKIITFPLLSKNPKDFYDTALMVWCANIEYLNVKKP